MFTHFVSLLGLSTLAVAAIYFENWAPPGHGDLRGPCPAMNSMANHHIIHHDGRNITVPDLVNALMETFNLSPELATIVSQLGLATNPEGAITESFDLPHLNKHNAFEHDASLSRVDFAFSGEEGIAKFDKATFARFFKHFTTEYITLQQAAAARYAMVQWSREHTPGFTYESQHQITSYAETIKYMKTMVDSTGKAKREFVRILFEQERLPFREGWRPPKDQTNGFVMAQSVMEEALATPEKSLWFGETPQNNDTTHDIPVCPKQ